MTEGAEILWFTGLSGSGKSTIAAKLSDFLKLKNLTVKMLDGDDVRRELHQYLDFSPNGIKKNNELIVELCLKYKNNFDFILVTVIAPFESGRQNARLKLGVNYKEIYMKVSLREVIRRDVKGLYQKALNGEIKNFIGLDPQVPYEEPHHFDLVLNSEKDDIETVFAQLVKFVENECQIK